jgi:hypothetical protein
MLSLHYDEVSLEGGLIEIDLDTGNEQFRLKKYNIDMTYTGSHWVYHSRITSAISESLVNKYDMLYNVYYK